MNVRPERCVHHAADDGTAAGLQPRATTAEPGGAVAGAYWRGSFLGTPEGYTEIDVDGRNVTSRYRTYGFRSQGGSGVPT